VNALTELLNLPETEKTTRGLTYTRFAANQ
jgi:hypothetical protein